MPFSIPSTPIRVNISGVFSARGFIEFTATFEGPSCDCCWGFPPYSCSLASFNADAGFVLDYDLTTTNDLNFEGGFIRNEILVLPIESIKGGIPVIVNLEGTFGLYARVDLRADRKVAVRTFLNISDGRKRTDIEAGFTLGIPPDGGALPSLYLLDAIIPSGIFEAWLT